MFKLLASVVDEIRLSGIIDEFQVPAAETKKSENLRFQENKLEKFRSLKKIEKIRKSEKNLRDADMIKSERANLRRAVSKGTSRKHRMKINPEKKFNATVSPRGSRTKRKTSKKRKTGKKKATKESIYANLIHQKSSRDYIDIYNTSGGQSSTTFLIQPVTNTAMKKPEKSFMDKIKGKSSSKKIMTKMQNMGWINKNLNNNPRSSLKLTNSSIKPSFAYNSEISKMINKNQFKRYIQKLKQKEINASRARSKRSKMTYTPSKSKLDSIEKTFNLSLKAGPQGTSVVQINNYVRGESSRAKKKRNSSGSRGKKKSARLSRFMRREDSNEGRLINSVRERLKKGKAFGKFF